jgi:hypothetical protein
MIAAVAVPLVYAALACATVVPPPGTAIQPKPTPVAGKPTLPTKPSQQPAWDFLGICTTLNEKGVQTYPSLNPK